MRALVPKPAAFIVARCCAYCAVQVVLSVRASLLYIFLYISLSVIMASAFFVGPRSTSIFCHPQRVEDIFDSVFLQLVFSLSLSTTIPCLHFRSRPDLILCYSVWIMDQNRPMSLHIVANLFLKLHFIHSQIWPPLAVTFLAFWALFFCSHFFLSLYFSLPSFSIQAWHSSCYSVWIIIRTGQWAYTLWPTYFWRWKYLFIISKKPN